MKLDELYDRIHDAVLSLNYEEIWRGFSPLKFALYDDESCFFDGAYIEKTDDFCANTSIAYKGEQIAIWKVEGDPDITVLTSKIVHEMFHGYQTVKGWDCWADESEALYRYRYNIENLTIRMRENELLVSLSDRFDPAVYKELLSHRKLRSEKFPYEYSYECKVEEIEGSATYVEQMVLRQLDKSAAAGMTARMRSVITDPECLFPIRISSYFTGALLINAMVASGDYYFSSANRPVIDRVIVGTDRSDGSFPGKTELCKKVSDAVASYNRESERIIRSALEKNAIIAEGPLELLGVNIYDARFYMGYITSRYFMQYRGESGKTTLSGNFVIRMADERTISRIYEWDGASVTQ